MGFRRALKQETRAAAPGSPTKLGLLVRCLTLATPLTCAYPHPSPFLSLPTHTSSLPSRSSLHAHCNPPAASSRLVLSYATYALLAITVPCLPYPLPYTTRPRRHGVFLITMLGFAHRGHTPRCVSPRRPPSSDVNKRTDVCANTRRLHLSGTHPPLLSLSYPLLSVAIHLQLCTRQRLRAQPLRDAATRCRYAMPLPSPLPPQRTQPRVVFVCVEGKGMGGGGEHDVVARNNARRRDPPPPRAWAPRHTRKRASAPRRACHLTTRSSHTQHAVLFNT